MVIFQSANNWVNARQKNKNDQEYQAVFYSN